MAADNVLIKNRGLGMLLSSMGGNRNTGGKEERQQSSGGNDASTRQRDARVDGYQKKTTGGNNDKGFDMGSQGFSGWGDLGGGGPNQGDNKMNPRNNGGQAGGRTKDLRDEDIYGHGNVNGWADMKTYNDDHDREWFDAENKRLAEQYGGDFINAKYLESQPERVGYYCQLCNAEMNARKSLDLHCRGMKHLKRKDLWEKGELEKVEAGENRGSFREKNPGPPAGGREKSPRPPHGGRDRSPPRTWSDRGNSRRDSRSHRGPSPPNYRRDDYGRLPDYRHDNYYRSDPMGYNRQPPFDRDPYGRGSPDFNRHSGPLRREDDRFGRDRFNPYPRREAPPPPVISGPNPGMNDPSCAPLFEGISDGSCSELLKKLSVCRVKSPEDTALATNVAGFLIMSLKEYFGRVGPSTVVHVLDEIMIKINIMRDLQKQ